VLDVIDLLLSLGTADHLSHCHSQILDMTQPSQVITMARDADRPVIGYTVEEVLLQRIVVAGAIDVGGTDGGPGEARLGEVPGGGGGGGHETIAHGIH